MPAPCSLIAAISPVRSNLATKSWNPARRPRSMTSADTMAERAITGTAAVAPAFFYAFQNIEENVRHQLQKLLTHPWIPKAVAIRGFVYDVTTGHLREIPAA